MASVAESHGFLTRRGLQDFIDSLNQDQDPRVGSTREGSDGGGTLSGANGSKTQSLSKLGSTFIPIIIYVAVCLIIFFIARRKCHRVYSPRTLRALRKPEEPTPALPNGWINWVIPFFKIPDTFVLNHSSLDGFFFLRFLKVLRNICLIGCLLAWPILFPLHATGGNGQQELELLTIGNVRNPTRLYANAVVAWLLFGFVLFTVARESIYYVNMRQAYLSSPYYSERLSSRTIMLSSVPRKYLDEHRLRKLYGDSVKRIWLPRTSKHLANLVKEREQTAIRLEKAEIELIQSVNKARNKQYRKQVKEAKQAEKAEKKKGQAENTWELSNSQLARIEEGNESDKPRGSAVDERRDSGTASGNASDRRDSAPTTTGGTYRTDSATVTGSPAAGEAVPDPIAYAADEKADAGSTSSDESLYTHPYGLDVNIPDVRGSVAAMYIPAQARPYHRPIANYGRRIDTIRWTRRRLLELNRDIAQVRKTLRGRNCKASDQLSVAFIEFDTQESAQAAHQAVAHHQPLHMAPRLIGIRPDEIVWSAIRMRWWERICRRFFVQGLIVAGVIFWSIPSAIVGIISNVQALTGMLPFLKWLLELPTPILGLITGFLPAIALSIFMALVPVMMRGCARMAGVPATGMVELFTQTSYFAFQVVQVFLVTTLTSAASSAFFDILMDPISAKDVLATNLPTASNFYISYILIQCLANAGTAILQPFELLRQLILGRVAQMPRSRFRVYHTMRPVRWGRDFPVFANLGVIALAYACIAPLILAFAGVGMWFTHIIWRYNLIFVLDSDYDTKGLFYPRALMHLTVGLYLAELCLIGLFFLNGATGPGVMMIMLFVFTGLVQFTIAQSIFPLLQNLPQTLRLEEEIQEEERAAAEAARARANDPDNSHTGAASSYYDEDQTFGEEDEDLHNLSDDEVPEPIGNRALEGAGNVRDTVGTWVKGFAMTAAKEQVASLGIKVERDPNDGPNFVTKWLNPHIHEDFIAIRKHLMTLPDEPPDSGDDPRQSYYPPELWAPKPILWIPQDEARVSRQEVAHTRKSTPISDKGARLERSGRIVTNLDEAPFLNPRIIL